MIKNFSFNALSSRLLSPQSLQSTENKSSVSSTAEGELLVQMTKSRSLTPLVTLLSGSYVICRLPPDKLRQLGETFIKMAERVHEPLAPDVSGITVEFEVK